MRGKPRPLSDLGFMYTLFYTCTEERQREGRGKIENEREKKEEKRRKEKGSVEYSRKAEKRQTDR